MIKVIHAASWLARRHFYSFSHRLYQTDKRWEEPPVWGGRSVLSAYTNELLRGRHTLIMAVRHGQVLARVLTGTAACTDAGGCREGYFALLDLKPDREALQALTDEMLAWHRRQGTHKIIGPIAPTPADIGGGVLYEGFGNEGAFSDGFNAEYYDELLRDCGFRTESEWLAYRLDIMKRFDHEKYRRASERLCARFGYRIDTRIAARAREYCEAVCRVMDIGHQEPMERVIGRLMPFIEEALSPIVFVGEEPVGFLLTIRRKSKDKHPQTPRIVTLWVHEKWRRKGVTAVLFDCFARQSNRLNITRADASLIREDNLASRLGVEYAGGERIRRYRQYSINI